MEYQIGNGERATKFRLVNGNKPESALGMGDGYQLLPRWTTFGDLNGDGVDDAVVVLETDLPLGDQVKSGHT
jgi:hypothetical protein